MCSHCCRALMRSAVFMVLLLSVTVVQAEPLSLVEISLDDFESGDLEAWEANSACAQVSNGTLAVEISGEQTCNVKSSSFALVEEGYLIFDFNPNGIELPPNPNGFVPGGSVKMVKIISPGGRDLAAIYLHWANEYYQVFLDAHDESGSSLKNPDDSVAIEPGWQQLKLGFRTGQDGDGWIALWIDGQLVLEWLDFAHEVPAASRVKFGKANGLMATEPVGTLLFDNVTFEVPYQEHLWVDAQDGDDANDGTSSELAKRTIQAAAHWAGPGSVVHILPGVYRETVTPGLSGLESAKVTYRAEEGAGTVSVRGSAPADQFAWSLLSGDTQDGLVNLPDNHAVYVADISELMLEKAPRFVVHGELDSGGFDRVRLAREPDYRVDSDWKHTEFWWAADGGVSPLDTELCNPALPQHHTQCDALGDDVPVNRSPHELTDSTDDTDVEGIEQGNLSTMEGLVGATMVVTDAQQPHDVYRRPILSHDPSTAHVVLGGEDCIASFKPALGWASKYYVEDAPSLLDQAGEWWYDSAGGNLYVWLPGDVHPVEAGVEVSMLEDGLNLGNRSHIVLEGLTVELFNDQAVTLSNNSTDLSAGITLTAMTIRHANEGIRLSQNSNDPNRFSISDILIENTIVQQTDSQAVYAGYRWQGNIHASNFEGPGIHHVTIADSEFSYAGFNCDKDNAGGLGFSFADNLTFENNHVHHIAHNGVNFWASVIKNGEVITGDIMVRNNTFEKACQRQTDCGGLKFSGSPMDGHRFRDVFIVGNILRDNHGWGYASAKRSPNEPGGEGSATTGFRGRGLYFDYAAGLNVYRNIAYNNPTGFSSYMFWRQGDNYYYNNISANNLFGFRFSGRNAWQWDHQDEEYENLHIRNNIIVNNEAYGLSFYDEDGDMSQVFIDHNLYFNNGWRSDEPCPEEGACGDGDTPVGGLTGPGNIYLNIGEYGSGEYEKYYLQTLEDIVAEEQWGWEEHGVAGPPGLVSYAAEDHDYFDGSWPNFHLNDDSPAIDQGTPTLPATIEEAVVAGNLGALQEGNTWDIGADEWGGDSDCFGHLVGSCNDESVCTFDICNSGEECTFEAIICDDDDACTVGSCDPESGCIFEDIDCDDDDACTVGSCDPESGCIFEDIDCDDDDVHTAEPDVLISADMVSADLEDDLVTPSFEPDSASSSGGCSVGESSAGPAGCSSLILVLALMLLLARIRAVQGPVCGYMYDRSRHRS